MAKMALEGIRVADWTLAAAGPSGTMWLAQFGAEVIKIEPREGERARRRPQSPVRTSYGILPAEARGINAYMENFNNSKKGITVDLTKEKGREIVYRLVSISDVFAHNRLADTVEKLGMDYETLLKYNPKLIYAASSVFGPKGPRRLTPAADTSGQGSSGLMWTSGFRGDGPSWATPGIGDFSGGYSLFSGVVMALLHRERTGEPQCVDAAQMQFAMNVYNLYALGQYLSRTEEERQADPNYAEIRTDLRGEAPDPMSYTNYYKCKDDRWVVVAAQQDKNWQAFCQALGEPGLANDPNFSTQEKRIENKKELVDFLDRKFAEKTFAEWDESFQGADCTFCPINRIRDLPNDHQTIANDFIFNFDHPVAGRIQYPGPPFTLSKTPASIRNAAPGLGEHTDEILFQLGYSVNEVLQLHEEQVV